MNQLICLASPATGHTEWICGRPPGHGPGLHVDIGERGAWNTGEPAAGDDFGGRLGEHIEAVVTAALAQAVAELGAADPHGPAPLAGAVHARAVEIAALTLGIPKEALL